MVRGLSLGTRSWTMADLVGIERPGRDEVGRALILKRGSA